MVALSAIWVLQGQLWVNDKEAASLKRLLLRNFYFDSKVTRSLVTSLDSKARSTTWVGFLFYKVLSEKVPKYIHDLVPKHSEQTWPQIRYSSYLSFRKVLLQFIRPLESKIFNISHRIDIKVLTGLGLGFSHLLEGKFRHNFKDTLYLLCSDNFELETTISFFLCFQFCLMCTMNFLKDSQRFQNLPFSISCIALGIFPFLLDFYKRQCEPLFQIPNVFTFERVIVPNTN